MFLLWFICAHRPIGRSNHVAVRPQGGIRTRFSKETSHAFGSETPTLFL
jgi:hypothetical protein